MFLPDTYNIGVVILLLSSVDLISIIGLLTVETLTREPNEKWPTFNEDLSADNDEFKALELIPSINGAGYFIDICG